MSASNALLIRATDNSSIKPILNAAMIVAGIALITIAAKIKVPLWPNPSPVNLQTLAIFTMASAYGSRLGLATIMGYMLAGAAGLPVFTNSGETGAGLAYFAGPTGGYLAGFVVMTYITGLAADRGWGKNPFKMGGAMLTGEIIMLIMGALWMGYLFGSEKIIAWGIGPFIVTDLIKLAIAACIVPAVMGLFRK